MRASQSLVVSSVALLLGACVKPKPHTSSLELDDPQCDGTEPGRACVTLQFSVADSVRKNTSRPLAGPLNWGLYQSGAVSLLGPGNNKSVYGGIIPGVDLTPDGTTAQVTLPNLIAQPYQVLAYIDETNAKTGVAASGDAVTFPSDPFPVPANQHTRVAVVFDFIR